MRPPLRGGFPKEKGGGALRPLFVAGSREDFVVSPPWLPLRSMFDGEIWIERVSASWDGF
jgi:hypothetical protein